MSDEWDAAHYCDLLEHEIDVFARIAVDADPSTPARNLPGWTLQDVLRQTGEMFRWIEPVVRERPQGGFDFGAVDLTGPRADEGYVDWMVAAGRTLVAQVRAADPDRSVWSWGYEHTARFWIRRAFYNTLVHRADAELALDRRPEFGADVAVDGTDEFLQCLPYAYDYSPRIAMLRGRGETLRLASPEAQWTIRLVPTGFDWSRVRGESDDAAQTVITAERSEDALLFVWGRIDGPRTTVRGDRELAVRWTELTAFN